MAMITRLENKDCMEVMDEYPDGYFDLAVVDPPYGIGITNNKRLNNNSNLKWDENIPSKYYFDELFRISINQIIWGGNYFLEYLKNTRCFINWDKLNHSDTYADCEMAWTSFDKNAKIFKFMWDGNRYGYENEIKGVGKPSIRTHPTQKPVQLYEWILKNYAKPEFKILDTHLGSGSSLIACHNFNIAEFVGCEIDKDYFDAMMKRYDYHKRQLKLF